MNGRRFTSTATQWNSVPTNHALHLFGLIPEGGIFFDPFSQHEFVKTSATTAVSSTEKDYIEDFHHNEMIVPIEDKGDERPE